MFYQLCCCFSSYYSSPFPSFSFVGSCRRSPCIANTCTWLRVRRYRYHCITLQPADWYVYVQMYCDFGTTFQVENAMAQTMLSDSFEISVKMSCILTFRCVPSARSLCEKVSRSKMASKTKYLQNITQAHTQKNPQPHFSKISEYPGHLSACFILNNPGLFFLSVLIQIPFDTLDM